MANIDIKFIAKKSGCSIATVSRVINRSKPVSEKLQKRVVDTIRKYNYNPSVHAQYLAGKKSKLFGFIMTNYINQYQLLLFRYLNEFACKMGYGCIIRYCNSGFEEKLEALRELEIRGIEVCFSLFLLSREEEAYIKEHFRIKVCHMQSPEMRLNIMEKNESSVYETICYLAQLGHRRIGGIFCIDEMDDSFLIARKRGFLRAVKQMQLDQEESLIGQIHGDYEKSSLISVIEKIFVPQKLPTALFCFSDEVAIEVMSWIMKHGYRIPEDVSVVSFDGIPFAERITPSLSTISQPVEYQAKSIINGMLYLQDGVERPCDEKENEYLLQIRDARAKTLIEAAEHSVGSKEGAVSARMEIRMLLEDYESRNTRLQEVMVLIEELVKQIPMAEKLLGIKGVGIRTVSGFLAEVGDISRFSNPKELQKLAGLALVENSSGKHKGETTISRRGRKRLRYLLFEVAMSLVAKNPEFRELHNYYTTRKLNPLKKMQSLMAVAAKLIRDFYAMLTKGVAYDPQKLVSDIRRPAAYLQVA